MLAFTKQKCFRYIAWVLLVTSLVTFTPVNAFAMKPVPEQDPQLAYGLTQKLTKKQLKQIKANTFNEQTKPDVRELTKTEMESIRGSGEYRCVYFNGIMPWQRNFHDVNTSNGNLFKSFTDIQVAPAKGAGLVLQRTYNSNDDRVGPFGVGWTHAYDTRMEEVGNNNVDNTGFFGEKHTYKRDADGLYTPPPYLHTVMSSEYNSFLVDGPPDVMSDKIVGLDGTIKHYIKDGADRVCDYIEDRHGNRTTLAYDLTATMQDGTTKNLLTSVTDPSDRTLTFTWTDLNPSIHVWRITKVEGPSYDVTYEYYNSSQNLDRRYNLYKVHLDPTGLNRTTTYDYTNCVGENSTEYGLLSKITDPNGNYVSYTYTIPISGLGKIWVSQIDEPAGASGRTVWTMNVSVALGADAFIRGFGCDVVICGVQCTSLPNTVGFAVFSDFNLRILDYNLHEVGPSGHTFYREYDTAYNVIKQQSVHFAMYQGGASLNIAGVIRNDNYTFGPHGHMLTHSIYGFPGQETYTYYTEDKYFQKASYTDMEGRVSTFDYGTQTDANKGNRGNMLWARDARYSQTNAQYTYTYNQYGQKTSETNLNGIVTTYTYGDTYGNLTKVIQDPGTGRLNRTTNMAYDESGRVYAKVDPNRKTSTVSYNVLGQPVTAAFPATSGTPAETVTYTYGANGRLASVTDNRGTTTIGYEVGSDRVASVTDPVTGTISYTYTNLGSVSTKTLPGGDVWTYNYTSPSFPGYCMTKDDPNSVAQTLQSVTDNQNRLVEFSIDATGYLRTVKFNQTFQNNNLISYCKTEYILEGVPDQVIPTTPSRHFIRKIKNTWNYKDAQGNWQSRNIAQNVYTFDKMGNRLTNIITDWNQSTRTETYGYDELYRLSSVNYGDGQTQTYTFDPMGNRLTKTDNINGSDTYISNAANMTTSRNGQGYVYDTNGNTLTGGGRTNVWDSQNRLFSCSFNGNNSSFTYGSDGLRRRSVVNGTRTDYVLDGDTVVREMRDTNNDGVLDPIATYFNGMYKLDNTTGAIRWYIYDGLGSVLAEVDPSGVVTAGRKYDVYGLVRTGQAGISEHKFVGKLGHMSEDETGLIYMRARYMDPVLGKFASEDPAKDGGNWFEYCRSNPINILDQNGKIVGPDDLLNEEAQAGSASVRGGMSCIQKLCDALERQMINQLEGLGAKVRCVGLRPNLRYNKGELQQYIWNIHKDGVTKQLRLDWSGHGGLRPHWNIKGPMNHSALEDFADVIEWLITEL